MGVHQTQPSRGIPSRSVRWPPLFEMYSMDKLVERLKGSYSRNYLVQVRSGRQTLSPKFRQRVSTLLRKTEKELFGK